LLDPASAGLVTKPNASATEAAQRASLDRNVEVLNNIFPSISRDRVGR
jgi:hypothetical protein